MKSTGGRGAALLFGVALFASLLLAAWGAEAKVKRIRPLAFKPAFSDVPYAKSPAFIAGDPGGAITQFWARLRLPRGAVITSVDFYYTAAIGFSVRVGLQRITPAGIIDEGIVTANTPTSSMLAPEKVPLPLLPTAHQPLKKGETFAVIANPSTLGHLWEVQVSYEP